MTQATTAPDATTPAPQAADQAFPSPESLAPTIEAILFSTDKPVSASRIAEALGLAVPEETPSFSEPAPTEAPPATEGAATTPASDTAPAPDGADQPVAPEPKPKKKKSKGGPARPSPNGVIKEAVAILNGVYEQSGRSFRIESLAGGYRVMMLPQFAPAIAALQGTRARTSLSQAALESLAIISYKQPITRARLEAIRGVACGEILRSLTERRLVTIVGRAEEVGRPLLYGTTKRFLELFGLSSLKDLPSVEDLKPKS